mmetsp:Transcript_11751/g.17836  ORF Transcript_11751/g.17836 Transcript_11751/m.17836 type:complete len:537 (+) Transcript_11751:103-1713(+)
MGQISCKAQLENPNPSLYSDELWEEAKGSCVYYRSSQAAVVFRLTCGLSAICSFLIIYLVLKSSTRLSSIYHRIMFGMSICQIITSFPRALTTLPMPAPGDYWTDIINIQGTRLGNTFTCTLQGFFIRFGDISAGSYFLVGLTFYYTCAIGFEMNIETLAKFVEPLIHSFCILWGLHSSLITLFVGGYNVGFDSYDSLTCTVAPKPWFCDSQNSTVPCVRGAVGKGKQLFTNQKEVFLTDLQLAVFIILCLLIICCRVYKKDREMAALLRRDWAIDDDHLRQRSRASIVQLRSGVYRLWNGETMSLKEIQQRMKDQYKDTKVIVSQAALYFSVQIFILACEMNYGFSERSSHALVVEGVIWSMQGFDLLFIFIFHQVFNQRRHHPDISISDAIIVMFQGKSGNEVFILSNIYTVRAVNKEIESDAHSKSFENNESTPLVSSCSLSGNFGSGPLTDADRSLISSALFCGLDDNSNIQQQSIYTNDEASRFPSYSPREEGDDELYRFLEENSAGLSRFSEESDDLEELVHVEEGIYYH